jgi:hypothetical protein
MNHVKSTLISGARAAAYAPDGEKKKARIRVTTVGRKEQDRGSLALAPTALRREEIQFTIVAEQAIDFVEKGPCHCSCRSY